MAWPTFSKEGGRDKLGFGSNLRPKFITCAPGWARAWLLFVCTRNLLQARPVFFLNNLYRFLCKQVNVTATETAALTKIHSGKRLYSILTPFQLLKDQIYVTGMSFHFLTVSFCAVQPAVCVRASSLNVVSLSLLR